MTYEERKKKILEDFENGFCLHSAEDGVGMCELKGILPPDIGLGDIKIFLSRVLDQVRQETLEEVRKIIRTHPEGEGDYCDTGEDMDWVCRSVCVELAIERLSKLKKIRQNK
jgi:hypothetical protein